MLNSFIIVLREGFESFLLVAVILSYLHKSGQKWLSPAVYVALGAGADRQCRAWLCFGNRDRRFPSDADLW